MPAKNKPKIALIGPVKPYRGGISQYNTQLQDSLKKLSDLKIISFKHQYPKLLYPGKSDIEPGTQAFNKKDASYSLSAYSPLSWRRVADSLISSDNDLVILTWWTLFWQPGFAYIAWRLRRRGVKTVFLCHNVVDHDSRNLKQRLSAFLLRQADGYIVHATQEAELIKELGIDKPVLNMKALPIYDHYPPAKGLLKKRGRLEILFFGFIRPYKGLGVLTDALAELNDRSIFFTIVGEVWGGKDNLEKELKRKNIPNLELHLEYVSDEDVAEYFNRADVVALPYLTATGSAVVSVAYNYRKPVLATSVGGLSDSVIDGKTGWLVKPNSPYEIKKIISSIDRDKAKALAVGVDKFCKRNSWNNLARKIVEFIPIL